MNEAERIGVVQDCLAEMREEIRTHAPNHKTDPAVFLLAALKRHDMKVVSEDEWEDQFEQGEMMGHSSSLPLTTSDEQRVFEALEPRFL